MKLYDTQYQRGDEEEKYLDTIRDQLLDCDAIILTYDVTKMETLERLRDFWLPFIRRWEIFQFAEAILHLLVSYMIVPNEFLVIQILSSWDPEYRRWN